MNPATPDNLAVLDRLLTTTRSVRKRLDMDSPVEGEVVEQFLEIALLAGWHKTDINRDLLDGPLGEEIRHKTPARRLGTADDLAGGAISLASDAAEFVTGTMLIVDGGYSIMDRQWQD